MSQISILDNTFRYGLGAFETVLVRNGVPLFADWHWESLCEAATALSIEPPDKSLLAKSIPAYGIWRWYATTKQTLDFFESNIPSVPDSFTLSFSNLRISSNAWESRYKTMSYLLRYQARSQAYTDEVLLVNEHEFVASASMANIFWVKDGQLRTPPLEAGCRNGAVRRWVIEKSGIPVVEGRWTMSDVIDSEELFLTNSRIGICPVNNFSGVTKPTDQLAKTIRERYDKHLSWLTTNPAVVR